MKTQLNTLTFSKKCIVDLNDSQLKDINGGGTPLFSISLAVLAIIDGCSDDEDPCADGGAGCGAGGGGGGGW